MNQWTKTRIQELREEIDLLMRLDMEYQEQSHPGPLAHRHHAMRVQRLLQIKQELDEIKVGKVA